MLQSFLSQAALIFLSTTLAMLAVACREDKQAFVNGDKQQPEPTISSAIAPDEITPSPSTSPDPQQLQNSEIPLSTFELGLDKAASADTISQSAQSAEDWDLVVSQYRDAIALMKQVEQQSPYFSSAQDKITQYHRQIQFAQQQAFSRREPPPQVVTPVTPVQPKKIVLVVPQPSPKPEISAQLPTNHQALTNNNQQQVFAAPTTQRRESVIFVAPIKRRVGGTPIIDVTFNGNQKFEMILDTGASGTVITQAMANALRIQTVGKAKANTASAKAVEFHIGYVESIEVAGVSVQKIPVAIAGVELEIGLLGHDFFGNHEITIKRDVVEFRPPSYSQQLNPLETGLTAPASSKPHHSGEYP